MRVLNTKFDAMQSKERYREVRGPDGKRFAVWRAGRRQRYAKRFAVGESANDKRIMRNARRAAPNRGQPR